MRRTIHVCVTALAASMAVGSLSCSLSISNTEAPKPQPQPQSPPAKTAPAVRALPARYVYPVEAGDEETDAQAWKAISVALGKAGELKDGVYTVTFPRDDLEVEIEGNLVPPAAGIASEFRFYRCPCGRINVVGQFVVADYEANDVIDALRQPPDARIEVASVGPLLVHERPRLTLVRFFGENKRGGALAGTLRTALSWTGKERMAPQPAK